VSKRDIPRRIDLPPRPGGAGGGVWTGGAGGGFDDGHLVRRDGTRSLYAAARWAWEQGAEVAGTLRAWAGGGLQVIGALFTGRREGPRAGLFNYRADGDAPSYVLEAVGPDNAPVFSAGALDVADPDTAWVNIGREGYPRIHFGALAGWNRRVPLVDAELIVGALQPWQVDMDKLLAALLPFIDHGALLGLADDDHTQYLRTDGARGGATGQPQAFEQGVILPTGFPLQVRDAAGADVVTVVAGGDGAPSFSFQTSIPDPGMDGMLDFGVDGDFGAGVLLRLQTTRGDGAASSRLVLLVGNAEVLRATHAGQVIAKGGFDAQAQRIVGVADAAADTDALNRRAGDARYAAAGHAHAGGGVIWQPLTNGIAAAPELVFAAGDVVMVGVTA